MRRWRGGEAAGAESGPGRGGGGGWAARLARRTAGGSGGCRNSTERGGGALGLHTRVWDGRGGSGSGVTGAAARRCDASYQDRSGSAAWAPRAHALARACGGWEAAARRKGASLGLCPGVDHLSSAPARAGSRVGRPRVARGQLIQ